MLELQFLEEVPQWALNHGLSDEDFDLLEKIALRPDDTKKILESVEYGNACGILQALEYAKDKGLITIL